MNVFISGGCKNGKSTYAEKIAVFLSKTAKPLSYIATMIPVDDEDNARIALHRQKRAGLGFKTIECGVDIKKLIDLNLSGTFLLDSTTALLANEMFPLGKTINNDAPVKIIEELLPVMQRAENMVIVSDYIYSDAQAYDKYTENYRKGLSCIDRACAACSDVVIEVSFNFLIFYKGQELLRGML